MLRTEDGDPELVEAIKQHTWQSLDTLSPRDKALCDVAHKLSGTPTRMVEEDWQPLRDLRFDDAACLEVAHIVGMFNYLTRMADGFGLQLDPETAAASESGIAMRRSE